LGQPGGLAQRGAAPGPGGVAAFDDERDANGMRGGGHATTVQRFDDAVPDLCFFSVAP